MTHLHVIIWNERTGICHHIKAICGCWLITVSMRNKLFSMRTSWKMRPLPLTPCWDRALIFFLSLIIINYNKDQLLALQSPWQTWGQFYFVNFNSTQFHFVNSNSTANWSIPIQNVSIQIPLFTYYFLPWIGTPSTYLEYLVRVFDISSWIVMEEIFLN
jgi:hypothetical protein